MKKLLAAIVFLICVSHGFSQTINIGGKVYQRVDGRLVYSNMGSSQTTGSYLFLPVDTATTAPVGSVALLHDSLLYGKGSAGWARINSGAAFDSANVQFTTYLDNHPYEFKYNSSQFDTVGGQLNCTNCGTGSGGPVVWYTNLDSLKAHTANDGTIAYTARYNDAHTTGAARYVYSASSTATGNDKDVVDPIASGAGRWLLSPANGTITPGMIGYFKSADNTADLTAIAAFTSGRYAVYFDEWPWVINMATGADIKSQTTYIGPSKDTVVFKAKAVASQNGFMFVHIGTGTDSTNDVYFGNMRLDATTRYDGVGGYAGGSADTGSHGIYIQLGKRLTFDNITLKGFSHTGIYTFNAHNQLYNNVWGDSLGRYLLNNVWDTVSNYITIKGGGGDIGLLDHYDATTAAAPTHIRAGDDIYFLGARHLIMDGVYLGNRFKRPWEHMELVVVGEGSSLKNITADGGGIFAGGFSIGGYLVGASGSGSQVPSINLTIDNYREQNFTMLPRRAQDSTGGQAKYTSPHILETGAMINTIVSNSYFQNINMIFGNHSTGTVISGGQIDNSGSNTSAFSGSGNLFYAGFSNQSGHDSTQNLKILNVPIIMKDGRLIKFGSAAKVDGFTIQGGSLTVNGNLDAIAEYLPPASGQHLNLSITGVKMKGFITYGVHSSGPGALNFKNNDLSEVTNLTSTNFVHVVTGSALTANKEGTTFNNGQFTTHVLTVGGVAPDAAGNVTVSGGGGSTNLARTSVTSGSSSTMSSANRIATFNPSSVLSTYTLTLPASPTDQQIASIMGGGTITGRNPVASVFSVSPNSGQSLKETWKPTALYAGDVIQYQYDSVTTTWRQITNNKKQTGLYNILDYGGTPDSATDNTAAFNRMKAAARVNGGGTLYIPWGKWGKTSTWTIDTSNTILRGEGMGTELWDNRTSGDVVSFTPNITPIPYANYFHDIGIYDISIQAPVARTSGYAVRSQYTHSFSVDGVTVGRFRTSQYDSLTHFYNGISFEGESNAVMSNTQIYAWHYGTYWTGVAIGAGFRNTGNFDGLITNNCLILGDTTKWHHSDLTAGVKIAGGTGGIQIEQSNVSFYTNGIVLDNSGTGTDNHQFFVGHAFAADNNGDEGILINNLSEQFQITGGWSAAGGNAADGVHNDGIYINPGLTGLETVITGGSFRYNLRGRGIYAGGGNITVSGAQFFNNGGTSDIELGTGVTTASINGNTFSNSAGVVNNAPVSTPVNITGNVGAQNYISVSTNASTNQFAVGNRDPGASAAGDIKVFSDGGIASYYTTLGMTSRNFSTYKALKKNVAYVYAPASDLVLMTDSATKAIIFAPGTAGEKARFDGLGHLGINTASPDEFLTVNGNIHSIGSLFADGLESGVGTKSVRYNPANGHLYYTDTTIGGGGGGASPGGSSGDIQFNNSGSFAGGGPTYNSSTGLISNTKNQAGETSVLISNSTSGGYGNTTISDGTHITAYGQTNAGFSDFGSLTNRAGYIYSTADTGFNFIADRSTGRITWSTGGHAETMRLTAAGDLGLGTQNPDSKLHVFKNSNALNLLHFENTNTGSSSASGLWLGAGGNSSYIYRTSSAYTGFANATILQDASGGDFSFIGAAENFRIANGGAITAKNISKAAGKYVLHWDASTGAITAADTLAGGGSIPDSISIKKILSTGSNPGITAGAGAGTSPTISVSGNDLTGTITLTAGSSPGTLTTLATITYNVPYGTKPHVFLVPTSLQAEQVANTVYIDDASSTATVFVIKVAGGSLTNGNSYTWYYHIIQ